MSGRLVAMVGGPLDGYETHAVDYKREQVQLFEAGDWSKRETHHVHVYRSSDHWEPFRYEGTREWVPLEDYVRRLPTRTIP